MQHFHARLAAGALLLSAACTAPAQHTVAITRQDQKAVPLAAYSERNGNCRGVSIMSPGAGGSEKGYRCLGEALSSIGYLAVVVGHEEGGRAPLRERLLGKGLRDGLADLIADPKAYRGRFLDIAAAREWARSHCSGPDSVLVGHSMGAATVVLEAGARNRLGLSGADSFNVYVAISPQGTGSIFPPDAWTNIKRPVLTLMGTNDRELGGASWESRTEPYRNMPAGCKSLAVITGATLQSK